MSRDSKSEIPMSKRFFPALLSVLGREKYERVQQRYRDLYAGHDLPENPFLRWHLSEGILPGLAFYQVLRESGESRQSALATIDRAFVSLFSDNVRKMKRLGRLPFIFFPETVHQARHAPVSSRRLENRMDPERQEGHSL